MTMTDAIGFPHPTQDPAPLLLVFLQTGIADTFSLAPLADPEPLVELETGFFSHTLIFL